MVVWKLSQLPRSLIHFTSLMYRLKEKGVQLRSITESFTNTTEKLLSIPSVLYHCLLLFRN